LEYLDLVGPTGHNESTPSLRFLGHQVDLKYLKLFVTDENFNLICGLKKLEALDLRSWFENPNLTNLHKLQTLRRLKVSIGFSKNILDHLKLGVFNDLEELEACFEGASVESIRKMKRIAPNLKKIGFIQCFQEYGAHLGYAKVVLAQGYIVQNRSDGTFYLH
jgi:hypothetical protein